MKPKESIVMVYTGNGKGKTTAALGLALRAIGHGARVFMVQFRKSDPDYGEIRAIRTYLPTFTVVQSARSRLTKRGEFTKDDTDDARAVFAKGKAALNSGQYDLVVFDEINFAMDSGLIPIVEVLDMLNSRPAQVDIVLTGRGVPPEVAAAADLVSEVREVKHHFQNGMKARPGIEF